ncbi:Cyclin-dependent kinase 2, partial [Paramuricea clavata]
EFNMPMRNYCNDESLPIFEQDKKERYTPMEAMEILTDKNIDNVPKCTKVPLRVRANRTFLMDTTKYKQWEDIKSDMMALIHMFSEQSTWTLNIEEYPPSQSGAVLNNVCLLQYHISTGEDTVEFEVKSHGSSKEKKPFYPCEKSVLNTIKERVAKQPASTVYEDVKKEAGGPSKPRNIGQLPRSRQQTFLKSKRTQVPPVFTGPTALHHSKTKATFKKIVDEVTSASPDLANKAESFITDGDLPLHESLEECLKHAKGLRCFIHFKRNCIDKLSELGRKEKKQQEFFLQTVFGKQDKEEGILDAWGKRDLRARLDSVKDDLDKEREVLKKGDNYESQFWVYLNKNSVMFWKEYDCKSSRESRTST